MIPPLLDPSTMLPVRTIIGRIDSGEVAVLSAILLLSISEILSISKLWNYEISLLFHQARWPLVTLFFAILVSKVLAVLPASNGT